MGPSDVPPIYGVAGHVTRVILPISIEELDFNHPFYIVDSMNHEIILGVDFLQEYKATVSFQSNSLVFQNSASARRDQRDQCI